jgi:hypothetical protein
MLGVMREEVNSVKAQKEPSATSRFGLSEGRGPEAATGMAPRSRLYFCVIDRFWYESREYGLIHMRLQHGIMNQETALLRERLEGGSS